MLSRNSRNQNIWKLCLETVRKFRFLENALYKSKFCRTRNGTITSGKCFVCFFGKGLWENFFLYSACIECVSNKIKIIKDDQVKVTSIRHKNLYKMFFSDNNFRGKCRRYIRESKVEIMTKNYKIRIIRTRICQFFMKKRLMTICQLF